MDTQFYPNELNKPIILSDEYDPTVGLNNKYYVLSTYRNDDGHEEFEVHKFDTIEEATRYQQYKSGQMSHDEYYHIPPLPDPTTIPHTQITSYQLYTAQKHEMYPGYRHLRVTVNDQVHTFTLQSMMLWKLKQKLLFWGVPEEALQQQQTDIVELLEWLKIPCEVQPAPGSKAIDDLLTSLTGKSRHEVITNNKCMTCDKPANQFRDALSLKEYTISGMCQACQDSAFGTDDIEDEPINV